MPYLLAETDLEDLTETWRPPWTESSWIFGIAKHEDSESVFVGCGTNGSDSFRVKGDVGKLQAFRDLMVACGGTEVRPLNVIIDPYPFPNLNEAQQRFDEYYGLSQAA